MSPNDEKCLLASVSWVVRIDLIGLVATNIRMNVVRMWSAHRPRCAFRGMADPFRRHQGAWISRDSTMGVAFSITRSKSIAGAMTAMIRICAESPG